LYRGVNERYNKAITYNTVSVIPNTGSYRLDEMPLALVLFHVVITFSVHTDIMKADITTVSTFITETTKQYYDIAAGGPEEPHIMIVASLFFQITS
jgi:hypothetical protein